MSDSTAVGVELYVLILGVFFISVPGFVMAVRLLLRSRHEGLMAMFTPPLELDKSKRRLSVRVSRWLYQRTSYGYLLDVAQAVLSAISCVLFIVVSYMATEPVSVRDVEDAFTVYFAIDYSLRLWMARDSLSWYFSLVSLLDFVTVFPALTTWLMQAGGEYDTNVAIIMESVRVFRVFRIFRVIRVVRAISVSASYAFQRQVSVLVLTVLSLVFAAAGLYQVLESGPGKQMPFHRAVYFATATVIGRPAVAYTQTATSIFLTLAVMFSATIIPTFVAELIRLWYDNTTADRIKGNPEAPHVIVCGDTNVSRLRSIVAQYFHPSRDPETQAFVVILAEAKPEGALRAFLDQHKHSGNVRYLRGSPRRAADLRRAAIELAKACIVLNYRSDKDATAADTEVLSTVMAIKNVVPSMRVLVQLNRPRKRNHLKAVSGWQDGDKSVSAVSLGMSLMGLSARIPGLSTFVVNLIRRGTALSGVSSNVVAAKTLPWWRLMLYGDVARPAAFATLHAVDPNVPRTPLEEYARSIDQTLHEMEVTPALVGRTFGAVARVAYLRYGITLMGATVPVNDDISALVPGLPQTFRLVLFPSGVRLLSGMKLYGVTHDAEKMEHFRVETGGATRSMLSVAMETVGSAFRYGSGSHVINRPSAHQILADEGSEPQMGAVNPVQQRGGVQPAGAAGTATSPSFGGWWAGSGTPEEVTGNEHYAHNREATNDLLLPWCFREVEELAAAETALLHKLHVDGVQNLPVINRFVGHAENCATCRQTRTTPQPLSLLTGTGIVTLASQPSASASDSNLAATATGAGAAAAEADSAASPGFDFDAAIAAAPLGVDAAAGGVTGGAASASRAVLVPRRASLGDDGLGGVDDTDDIIGTEGPLLTVAPHISATTGIGATARAAAKASVNALAVHLALPITAVTDVDSMAAEALDRLSTARYSGHILICGVSDNMGYLLRAIATIYSNHHQNERTLIASAAATFADAADAHVEGDQYDIRPEDIVVLAQAKPADAALDAMYPGSSRLLARTTFIKGSPAEAADLLKAGVMTARGAVVLTSSKPTVTADGSDNLSDDTDAIVTTAIISKLNPGLHVITELLHGAHAPYVRPTGSGLTDAQRGALIAILEEREASRQRAKLDNAIRRVAIEQQSGVTGPMDALRQAALARVDILMTKLQRQQARLRAAMTGTLVFNRGLSAGSVLDVVAARQRQAAGLLAGVEAFRSPAYSARAVSTAATAPDGGSGAATVAVTPTLSMSSAVYTGITNAVNALESTTRVTTASATDRDLEQLAEKGLSNSAIVDVLVGVREDFGSAASAAANEGAAFSMGGGAGGGQSKGSGATNDLFAAPSFAAGRVFAFNTLDSIICEAHFETFIVGVLKQLVRAARKQRFITIPITEAIIMARLAHPGASFSTGAATPAAITRAREHYMSQLASGILNLARGTDGGAAGGIDAAASPAPGAGGAEWMSLPVETYGELFEALLRGWNLLPVGMYRRVHPAAGLRASSQTVAALQLAAGPPPQHGAFVQNRALVSYVLTNPPPSTRLAEHDMLYVMLPEEVLTSSGFTDVHVDSPGASV